MQLSEEQITALKLQMQQKTIAELEAKCAQQAVENARLRLDILIRDISRSLNVDPAKVQFHFQPDGSVTYTVEESHATET